MAAGGGRWTDRAGRVWEADTGFTGGAAYANGNPIAGTDSPELYQHERFNEGPFSYTFCVPEGLYTVRLKFAEIWFREPGRRVYDVVVNGRTVLRKFDPLAAAGEPNRAVDREFRVAAEKHEVRIDFRPVVGNPKVSAIEIVPLPAARPTATRLSGQPRYRNRFALSRSS